ATRMRSCCGWSSSAPAPATPDARAASIARYRSSRTIFAASRSNSATPRRCSIPPRCTAKRATRRRRNRSVRTARWIFAAAAIYGVPVLLPLYGLEQRIGRDAPPPITHPEYFYGFVGVALTMQALFVLIATDPERYRPAMLISVLGKLSFGVPMMMLYSQGRVAPLPTALAGVDLALAVLFVFAYVRTPRLRA